MTLTQRRVAALPDSVRDCEPCGGEGTMAIRRSSLRPEPCADDVLLKYMTCYRVQTHGIPISREQYEREMELRGGSRIRDMVDDGPDSVESNLASLGYIDY